MGSCVSKCYTSSSSSNNDDSSSVVQEKLVISESIPANNTFSCDASRSQTPSSASSFSLPTSSPSVSSSNSSASSSASSSTLSTSISSFPQSSCAKENPRIVVLDPLRQHGGMTPRHVEFPVQTPQPTLRALPGSPYKQPLVRNSQPSPAKRARSSSPTSAASRKSFKTERKPNLTNRRREVGFAAGNIVPLQMVARKENDGPPSPYNPPRRPSLSVEKETRVHHIHGIQNTHEVSYGIPLAEDLNNPLISMDCFIFL